MALTTYYSFKYKISPQQCKTFNVLKKLESNKGLVITKLEKSNRVVLLNRGDYVRKIKHLLQDFTKFTKIDKVGRALFSNTRIRFQDLRTIFSILELYVMMRIKLLRRRDPSLQLCK